MVKTSKPVIVLIIQARMGSVRLPGKSMMDLAGAPLVGRIIERVKRSAMIDKIVLATTAKAEDDVLENLAQQHGVLRFRGSENDLVDRYYQAAKAYEAEVIVRLPADNPIPQAEEMDRIVQYHLGGGSDFSTNLAEVERNGYPNGIGAEVFNFSTLEDIWTRVVDPIRREHVALNFYDYLGQKPAEPERYRVGTVRCPSDFRRPDLAFEINTIDQYRYIKELYEYVYPRKPNFHIRDVIIWHDQVYMKKGKENAHE